MSGQLTTEWTRIRALHTEPADAAWAWFVDRYRTLVHSMLSRNLLAHQVEPATIEFWGYLWNSRSVLRANLHRSFRSYLFGILHRYALAWARNNARVPQTDLDLEQVQSVDAHEEDDRLWALDCLRAAFDRLQIRFPLDAMAIRLFYGIDAGGKGERLSVSGIAERMQKSIASVHQHLSRGRSRLRDLLASDLRRTVGSDEDHASEAALLFAELRRHQVDLAPDRFAP